MSCQQVPTTPAFNLYPRSVQVGEFEVAIDGGIWVAIRDGFDKMGHSKYLLESSLKGMAAVLTFVVVEIGLVDLLANTASDFVANGAA